MSIMENLTAIDPWSMIAAAIAGLLLGIFYYGGLWWTVRQVQTAKRVGLLFAVSFMVRTAVVVGGLFLMSGGDWLLIVIALIPFFAVRTILIRRLGPALEGKGSKRQSIVRQ